MVKKSCCILLLLLLSFFITSCSSQSESLSLKICGSYAVPGMFCDDLKGDSSSCEIVEQDSYGRVLFIYSANHIVTKQRECAYVICQKYDSDHVYFYEDICYFLGEASEEEISALKERNDWGLTLNSAKMSSRSGKSTFDLYIVTDSDLDYQQSLSACRKKVGQQKISLTFMDENQSGCQLMFLQFEQDNQTKSYIAMIDQQYNVRLLPIEGDSLRSIDPEELTEFKAKGNWWP